MSFIGNGADFQKNSRPAEVGQRHDIVLNIVVKEEDALWCAAADRLAAYGLEPENIEACIGPRADISVIDCLRTLLVPFDLAGCAVQDVLVAAGSDKLETFGGGDIKSLIAELSQSVDASAKHLLLTSDRDR